MLGGSTFLICWKENNKTKKGALENHACDIRSSKDGYSHNYDIKGSKLIMTKVKMDFNN